MIVCNHFFVLVIFLGEQVKMFYDSCRTVFSKVTHPKSGKAREDMTEREKYIVDSFHFLKGHIHYRTRSKSSVSILISKMMMNS